MKFQDAFSSLIAGLPQSKSEVTRDWILNTLESDYGISHKLRGKVCNYLKGVDPKHVLKRNPIIYSTKGLLKFLSKDAVEALIPTVAKVEVVKTEVQRPAPSKIVMEYDINVMNAADDPSLDKLVRTSSYRDVERKLNPNYPMNVYIYGETGLGKSSAVLCTCKKQKRTVIRVNMSFFSDVDDLLGGLRIENGSTIFRKGPVTIAMETGAVLLLDEVDTANPQLLMELHPVLEGKGILLKKINQMVYPIPGFCTVATGNTKGRGDLTGNYSGTSVMNKAFLDRFATSVGFKPATESEMTNILINEVNSMPESLAAAISQWYVQITEAFKNGAVPEFLSTRKIIDIGKLMMIAGVTSPSDKAVKEAIEDGTNIYDDEFSKALTELWDNITVSEFQPA